MVKFRMYAEYDDGAGLGFTHTGQDADEAESLCMCEISDAEEEHGECTYYTADNTGYDEELGGYWVDGEWFDGWDEESGMYYKNED